MTTRNDLLRRVHAAARAAGLDDDTYRDTLERVTGKRSAKECSDDELSLVLNSFHVKRTRTSYAHHTKIKALYIACYNIGAMQAGTDAAIDGFCHRQTGKLRLGFVTPAESVKVIEPLKAILVREGVAAEALDGGGIAARVSLCEAQWAKLHRLGAMRTDYGYALLNWSMAVLRVNVSSLKDCTEAQLDTLARRLGGRIRQRQAQRAAA